MPAKDVAAVGGWLDTSTLQDVYQQADPETMEQVVLGARELRMKRGEPAQEDRTAEGSRDSF